MNWTEFKERRASKLDEGDADKKGIAELNITSTQIQYNRIELYVHVWFHSKPIPCPFPSHHKTSQQMKIAESHASKPLQQLVRHLCSIISSFSIQMCTTENSAVFYDCFPFFAFFHSFFDIDLPNFFFARFWLDLIYVNCFFFSISLTDTI